VDIWVGHPQAVLDARAAMRTLLEVLELAERLRAALEPAVFLRATLAPLVVCRMERPSPVCPCGMTMGVPGTLPALYS
jgi:hypothetical protein